ncbi:tetratricopeptide repeat protein [Caballeronia sp. J97]|uniref:tetratricopeptide repeat protein n=1 Tax=Caballeronia sp. J97 TaxID=2805429 RepID=UPI002AAFB719|nr:tetratricopeptide repeat protein [Caballeronia sp. J97]
MHFDPDIFQLAATHYAAGRYADALAALSVMLGHRPAHREALNLAAICCFQLNRQDDAEAYWRRAIADDPDYAGGYGNLANLFMTQGRLSDAESAYRQAIRLKPDFAEAHYNLGNLLNQLGRLAQGEAALRDALTIRPDFAEAHYNLANSLKDQRRTAEAEAEFRAAIAARPDYADALNNLGNLLRETGHLTDAQAALRQAIRLRPRFAEAHFNLGQVWWDARRVARAQAYYRRAIELRPDYADAHLNLGIALSELKRPRAAEAAFRAALSLRPDDAQATIGLGGALHEQARLVEAAAVYRQRLAHYPDEALVGAELGNVLQKLGRFDEAEAAYRAALSILPGEAGLHYNLGKLLGEQRRFAEAETSYRRAIELRPDFIEALNNLGLAVRELGRLSHAEAILRRSLALRPEVAETHNNLAGVLKDMGAMDESLAEFREAVACSPENECVHRNLNYALTYHAEDPREILDECLRFAARHEAPFMSTAARYPNDRTPSRRLRIGYVAPDFNAHCQSMFTSPVFAAHDHESFEIVCYSSTRHTDEVTEALRTMTDIWRDVHELSDEALAQRIRDDRIDVLVDLTLHMSRGRPLLFARRPAPVQVQWLGYPGTTGSRAIRYRLTDPWIDPPDRPEVDACYSERSIRLPDTFWCYDARVSSPDAPSVGPLPARENGYVTFGCLNNPCKASDRTLRMWAAVLAKVPDARFVLLAPHGARERFRERLSAVGADPLRIEWLDYQPRAAYLRTYHRIDIGLDTFPYNGHTTSLDALWMGVPVPSRAGETAVSRAGFSLLMNLGLGDLVAHDDDAYVDIVSRLAHDLPRLTELRESLRTRLEASTMMDGQRFTRHLEDAYRQMWREWCASPGEMPDA